MEKREIDMKIAAFRARRKKKMNSRLRQDLPRGAVKQKKGMDYINSGTAIQAMNDSVGCTQWSSRVDHWEKAFEREWNGKCNIGYLVQVTVWIDGFNSHQDMAVSNLTADYANLGELHDNALKSAVTDAHKRALRYFGVGLSLYKPYRYISRKCSNISSVDAKIGDLKIAPETPKQPSVPTPGPVQPKPISRPAPNVKPVPKMPSLFDNLDFDVPGFN